MAAFVDDGFTDTNGTTLQSHTEDTAGGGWSLASGANVEIQNNRIQSTNAGSTVSYYSNGAAPPSADYYAEALVVAGDANTTDRITGVLARYDPVNENGYAVVVRFDGIRIYRIDSGALTALGGTNDLSPWSSGDSWIIRIEVEGSTIRALVNGVEDDSVTDSTYTAAGESGVVLRGTFSGIWEIDDFIADGLGGGGTTDDLTAQDIATGSPTVDSASIAQNHALTGADIATQSPVVESASISQQHALTAQDVAAQAPTVDSPELSESHQLTAQDVAAQAPTVGSPGISQVHGLTAQDVATQAPAVESPSIGQVHALSAQDVAAGSPVVDSATLSSDTTDALTAQDITAGTPTVGAADLSQNHALAVADILSAAPQITSPAIAQVHALTAQDVVAGVPVVDSPTLNAAIISARPGDGPNITQLRTGSPNKTELIGGPNITQLRTGSPNKTELIGGPNTTELQ